PGDGRRSVRGRSRNNVLRIYLVYDQQELHLSAFLSTTQINNQAKMLAKRYAEMQLNSQAAVKARAKSAQKQRPSGAEKRVNVNQLKEFYLKRLEVQKTSHLTGSSAAGGASSSSAGSSKNGLSGSSQNIFGTTGGLTGSTVGTPASTFGSTVSTVAKNRIALPKADANTETVTLCLNTNTLETENSKLLGKSGTPLHLESLPPVERVENYNSRLSNFAQTLQERIEKNQLKAGVTRHLTQVKYHLETAKGWTMGCVDIGVLSEHTVVSLASIVSSALTLVPQEYVISKRVHTIVREKEKYLRKLKIEAGQLATRPEDADDLEDADEDERADGAKSEVTSVVGLSSYCGTEISATDITATSRGGTGLAPPINDVANLSSLQTDMNACKTDEDKRRWFYSQCLTVKLKCTDKDKAKKTLISDIYKTCLEQKIPMENWTAWIHEQFGTEQTPGSGAQSPALSPPMIVGPTVPQTAPSSSSSSLLAATTSAAAAAVGRSSTSGAASSSTSANAMMNNYNNSALPPPSTAAGSLQKPHRAGSKSSGAGSMIVNPPVGQAEPSSVVQRQLSGASPINPNAELTASNLNALNEKLNPPTTTTDTNPTTSSYWQSSARGQRKDTSPLPAPRGPIVPAHQSGTATPPVPLGTSVPSRGAAVIPSISGSENGNGAAGAGVTGGAGAAASSQPQFTGVGSTTTANINAGPTTTSSNIRTTAPTTATAPSRPQFGIAARPMQFGMLQTQPLQFGTGASRFSGFQLPPRTIGLNMRPSIS
ncbi:unnamed protein product, partial [Amoebophrya sp. A120]